MFVDSPVLALWKSPLGWIGVAAHDRGLLRVTVPRPSRSAARADLSLSDVKVGENEYTCEALDDLARYFAGDPLVDFRNLELDMSCGTPFERQVWNHVRTIPHGETRTYGEIAQQVGRPKAARAVGACNAKNPWAIIVPCHRLIGANGDLVGYGGGIKIKKRLLDLEKNQVLQRGLGIFTDENQSLNLSASRAMELVAASWEQTSSCASALTRA